MSIDVHAHLWQDRIEIDVSANDRGVVCVSLGDCDLFLSPAQFEALADSINGFFRDQLEDGHLEKNDGQRHPVRHPESIIVHDAEDLAFRHAFEESDSVPVRCSRCGLLESAARHQLVRSEGGCEHCGTGPTCAVCRRGMPPIRDAAADIYDGILS